MNKFTKTCAAGVLAVASSITLSLPAQGAARPTAVLSVTVNPSNSTLCDFNLKFSSFAPSTIYGFALTKGQGGGFEIVWQGEAETNASGQWTDVASGYARADVNSRVATYSLAVPSAPNVAFRVHNRCRPAG